MRADAPAKVNFGLRVKGRREDGYHELVALNGTVSWTDELELEAADEDHFSAPGAVPDDTTNLAWQAMAAVRAAAGRADAVSLRLAKSIPAAAGLGGGSADAAAALVLAAGHFGLDKEVAAGLAADLGSDVPFCLVGGTAVVTGRGEHVSPEPFAAGFAIAIVVPPFELATADVFSAWSGAAGAGVVLAAADLPPPLRAYAPLGNDLYPAAVRLRPEVEGWRQELAERWGRPVVLSGSGPALFAYFVDEDEAMAALGAVPVGARDTRAVVPMPERVW